MFVDKVNISLQAGNGGNGRISFRREKFIDRGGPNGGDGGKGGDVVLVASQNQNTLAAFRHKKLLKAKDGLPGDKQNRHGKNGQDLEIPVPVGTVVANDTGTVLVDLTKDGQKEVIARGGNGGFGNAHFTSSRRQAPKFAEKGERGDILEATLELKLIADVGIIGKPNAGKSTLLSIISHAHPQIADYPFTTLTPNLGVVDIDKKKSLLFADIPGLIEGASKGKGLGDEFLRHIERTSVLVHLIDIYDDAALAYKTVQGELKAYAVDLSKRPQIVALTKIEGLDEKDIDQKIKELKKATPARTKIMAISAKSRQNLPELLYATKNMVDLARTKKLKKIKKPKIPILRLPSSENSWSVTKKKTAFVVEGKKIERFAERTDFDNSESVARLKDIMQKMGIAHELLRKDINLGNKVKIGPHKFEW